MIAFTVYDKRAYFDFRYGGTYPKKTVFPQAKLEVGRIKLHHNSNIDILNFDFGLDLLLI